MQQNKNLSLIKVLRDAIEVNDIPTILSIFEYLKQLGVKEYLAQGSQEEKKVCQCQKHKKEITE